MDERERERVIGDDAHLETQKIKVSKSVIERQPYMARLFILTNGDKHT
jgi:hypothetical protein